MKDVSQNKIQKTEIEKLVGDFLEYCEIEKGHSALTIENYHHYLKRFTDWSKNEGTRAPGDIDLDLIRKYRLFLNRLGDEKGNLLKKITQNYHVIALRAFLRYLAKRDIKSLAAEKIELADTESRHISFLDIDEIERLLAAPDLKSIIGKRDHAIVEVLFSTGLRVSELVGLNCKQVNLERGEFAVTGKGSKTRIVFLSDSARDTIKSYIDARKDSAEPLFIHHNKKEEITDPDSARLTARSIQRMIKKHALAAGIVKKVTPHVMRHSFATDLLINGADIRSVQQMLGHSSITTTQIYTHITNKQLREVHQAFHGKRKKE